MVTTVCAVHLRTHPQHILQNSMLSLVLLHNSSRSKSWCVSKELRVKCTTNAIRKIRKPFPVFVGLIQLNSAGLSLTHQSSVLALLSSYTIVKSRPIKLCNPGRLYEVCHLDACPTATRNSLSTHIRTSPVHTYYDSHSNKIEFLCVLIKICSNSNNNIW